MQLLNTRLGELDCRIVAHGSEAAQHCVILCHGYGAPGDDLVPVAQALLASFARGNGVRFVLPEAPLALPGLGHAARAWWEIDVGRIMEQLARGLLREVCNEVPTGLPAARRKLLGTIEHVRSRWSLPAERIVLSGFSQGAMLCTDVALRLDEVPAGLCVFSGTLICASQWQALAKRRRGLPVFQCHGTADPLLPYQAATWLHELFTSCSLDATFQSFADGHTIPEAALEGASQFLHRVVGRQPRSPMS
jgi:phospholipase/carboxylesterase